MLKINIKQSSFYFKIMIVSAYPGVYENKKKISKNKKNIYQEISKMLKILLYSSN